MRVIQEFTDTNIVARKSANKYKKLGSLLIPGHNVLKNT